MNLPRWFALGSILEASIILMAPICMGTPSSDYRGFYMIHIDVPSIPSVKHQVAVTEALAKLRTKVKKDGTLAEYHRRRSYMAPSRKRRDKRDRAAAQRKRDSKRGVRQ
jgi:ribosomal protein S21